MFRAQSPHAPTRNMEVRAILPSVREGTHCFEDRGAGMTHDAEYLLPSGRTRLIRNISFQELEALHTLADESIIPLPEEGFLLPATNEEMQKLIAEMVGLEE